MKLQRLLNTRTTKTRKAAIERHHPVQTVARTSGAAAKATSQAIFNWSSGAGESTLQRARLDLFIFFHNFPNS